MNPRPHDYELSAVGQQVLVGRCLPSNSAKLSWLVLPGRGCLHWAYRPRTGTGVAEVVRCAVEPMRELSIAGDGRAIESQEHRADTPAVTSCRWRSLNRCIGLRDLLNRSSAKGYSEPRASDRLPRSCTMSSWPRHRRARHTIDSSAQRLRLIRPQTRTSTFPSS